MDIQTDSTDCTGDQPAVPNRSRQMKPLEYICGCMGTGRAVDIGVGLVDMEAGDDGRGGDVVEERLRNVTSGASVKM